ncbi:hypothetical protein FOA43_001082 [Brettanomyces nanus]|uniref:Uncharacterized protein n=1 Tax=Eeniella nana TaxID=13502 RepID=A0A875RYI0_EENNA|nr:uncharacterized protein FOA43_001082 [Brettanomyces nanus]QPG73768.1 hypothetical protein FOA43_001082 [Brettanomyces nanus]
MIPESSSLFDDKTLLEPEEVFYQQGFREGQSKVTKADHLEGKQLGIQTGFQRLLIVGALKQIVKFLQLQIDQKRDPVSSEIFIHGKQRSYDKISRQLEEIRKMLNVFFDGNERLNVRNTSQEVDQFEKLVKRSRAKVRSLCSMFGYTDLYSQIESNCQIVGGQLPTADVKGADTDTW